MRKLFVLVFLLPFLGKLMAQTVISGTVKDAKNNPIAGASLAIRDSYDGGITDSSGRFSFMTTEKGEVVLVITAVGYRGTELKLDLKADNRSMAIILKEEVNELKAVVITAGSFEASDRKRTTVLNTIDILTTASANADVTGAIRTLPGAQQVGESEGLFVRGGTASETKTFIDGTLVNNFFYSSVPNIAQRGRFSPWLFRGTVFSAGGYSALYGQALSSALILESVDLPDKSSGNLGLSFLGGSFGYQKLVKNKKASWGLSYGYTNLDLAFRVLKQKPEYFLIPAFHTGDANFRIRTSASGMVKYYGYFSQNKLGLRNPSIDTTGFKEAFRLKNLNMYHNISWREQLGNLWKFNVGFSYATNRDDIRAGAQDQQDRDVIIDGFEYKNFMLDGHGRYINGKAMLERRLGGLSALRFGSEFNHSNDWGDYTNYNGNIYPVKVRENIASVFAETDVYLMNELAAKLGARLEHSELLGAFNLAPRASLAYKTGEHSQASLAYGIFFQDPERRYLPSEKELDFTKAVHYIAQYQKVTGQQTLRMELYYKKYTGLLKTTVENNREIAASNAGYGYARGIEIFWRDKKSIKQLDYWISYSFLDTKRDFLNYPFQLRPGFASKHTANLVLKKFVSAMKTQFNANYVYASGRPYYDIRNNNGTTTVIRDQGKTIPYNSLSISVNYLPNVFSQGAGKFTVFVLSVTNVLGSRQVFGYNYSYNGIRKEPIVPPTKTFIYLGAFISFGVDRSQDAINNNL